LLETRKLRKGWQNASVRAVQNIKNELTENTLSPKSASNRKSLTFSRDSDSDDDDDSSSGNESDYIKRSKKEILPGTSDLINAASDGDITEVKRLIKLSEHKGQLAAQADYDGRTPLHLAASKGHKRVVKYLITLSPVNINAVDRWKNTPLKEALRYQHDGVVKILRKNNAVVINQDFAYKSCTMASEGDIDGLARIKHEGGDLNFADHDVRTALHLAASNGHFKTVNWLLMQGVHHTPKDKFGNTPLDDAKRGNHSAIVKILQLHERGK